MRGPLRHRIDLAVAEQQPQPITGPDRRRRGYRMAGWIGHENIATLQQCQRRGRVQPGAEARECAPASRSETRNGAAVTRPITRSALPCAPPIARCTAADSRCRRQLQAWTVVPRSILERKEAAAASVTH